MVRKCLITTWYLILAITLAAGLTVLPSMGRANADAAVEVTFETALIISDVTISNISYHSARVSWETNDDASSQVFYDTESHEDTIDYAYQTDEDVNLVSEHTVYLSGLSSGTTYHFRARSVANGLEVISDDYTFRTSSSGGGGGDGGGGDDEPPPSIPPPPGTTDVSDYIDTNGVFQNSILVESEDGFWTLAIGKGTTGLTEEGAALSEILKEETEVAPAIPDEPCIIIGPVCNLGPDGATFTPSTTITFSCDSPELPWDVNEMNMIISFWDADAGEWIQLEGCIVDRTSHTISAPLSHFTTFAALACTRQANFIITDLSIFPQEVDINGSATIKALVTNTGDRAGSYEVVLKIDGEEITAENMVLAGGASREVTFTIVKEVAGNYLVDVNGLTGLLTVEGVTPMPTPTPTTSPVPTPLLEVFNWPLTIGITGGIIVLAVFAERRRRRKKV